MTVLDSEYWRVVLLLWPLLVGALVFAEVSLFCAARGWFRAVVLIGVATCGLLVVLDYALQPLSYAMQMRPVAYFLVIVWIAGVPLAILSAAALLLAQVNAPIARHLGILVISVVVIAVLPLFGLWSICTSGVDCI